MQWGEMSRLFDTAKAALQQGLLAPAVSEQQCSEQVCCCCSRALDAVFAAAHDTLHLVLQRLSELVSGVVVLFVVSAARVWHSVVASLASS